MVRREDPTAEPFPIEPARLLETLAPAPARERGSERRRPAPIDLRSRTAYLRDHLAGAVSVPWSRLDDSLFLLPPRRRPLLAIGRDSSSSASAARRLARGGWRRVAWLAGRTGELPPRLRRSGPEPNRLWEPAAFLRRIERQLPSEGLFCDLACGSGRNGVFLALTGRRVLGIDRLPDALRRARRLAREAAVPAGRLSLRAVRLGRGGRSERELLPGRFQGILCFRFLDRALWPRMLEALAPGGILVFETFLEQQRSDHGRPRSAAHLLRPGELRELAGRIEILRYEEGEDPEGNHLASLLARRPR